MKIKTIKTTKEVIERYHDSQNREGVIRRFFLGSGVARYEIRFFDYFGKVSAVEMHDLETARQSLRIWGYR